MIPPLTPRRVPSPTMSPGRRGRSHGISEESGLRDLSPDTTLAAFTHSPVPFDTSQEEYKIFSCIDALTAAERDLGMRVAKAAQRLKSWCSEIEQWGWSGSFEPPSAAFREQRRKSLEQRIREHLPDAELTKTLRPLEYWGSLLSDEVEQHEARLDDIEDELLKLDVEELKEHVLDMHPSGRSRPSSAGFEAVRQTYKPMDDFSFLITQTLLSALPHHAELKDRLSTWAARVAILRDAPSYLGELETAQTAMRLAWDAIEPPRDTSDAAFSDWKEAIDTISDVLRTKVGHLGKRLDRMLDTLEGREDCLPDDWIDVFEVVEADFSQWAHDSRRSVIEYDVRRRVERGSVASNTEVSNTEEPSMAAPANRQSTPEAKHAALESPAARSYAAGRLHTPVASPRVSKAAGDDSPKDRWEELETPTQSPQRSTKAKPSWIIASLQNTPTKATDSPRETKTPGSTGSPSRTRDEHVDIKSPHSLFIHSPGPASIPAAVSDTAGQGSMSVASPGVSFEAESPLSDESFFEEGDTVVHNDIEDDTTVHNDIEDDTIVHNDIEDDTVVHNDVEDDILESPPATLELFPNHSSPTPQKSKQTVREALKSKDSSMKQRQTEGPLDSPLPRHHPTDSPMIITSDGTDSMVLEPPQTPRSRRGSTDSLSSDLSFESSPTRFVDDSPSVRTIPGRAVRAPRPELNAAMAKRRAPLSTVDDSVPSTPWPPTQFTKPINSAEDLERKISDILTTIPAHIRLTTGPGADAPEVKPRRGVTNRDSRGYLRAGRTISGLKSPELTLSPAKNQSEAATITGRKSSATMRMDNDIKLYHLTQPGKEHPVKLFIRRVGENGERVMVRVGGGWADLGEYLRQYAEHHGRRTVSEGKFEILGLEANNQDNSPARSESSMSKRDRRVSGARAVTTPVSTPIKSPALGVSANEAPASPAFAMSPGIPEEMVPSTNSSQRSWQGNEVGLAGPRSKKLDLSGEKLEWIEGMMKQARTVSGSVVPTVHQHKEQAEARSDSRSDSRTGARKSDFGDLGKVGGTKRIFLRGG